MCVCTEEDNLPPAATRPFFIVLIGLGKVEKFHRLIIIIIIIRGRPLNTLFEIGERRVVVVVHVKHNTREYII